MALTPNDVLNKQFETTRFKDGYDQDQVDDFLDEVLAEFQRLIAENDTLKTQLSTAPSTGQAPQAPSGEAETLRSQLAEAQSQIAALQAQLQQAQQAGADGMGSAEYLQLARRVHEEHVREGVAKRDQLIAEGTAQSQALMSEAKSRVDAVIAEAQTSAQARLGEAQSQAASIVSDAQAKAEALARQAQEAYDAQAAQLAAQVSALERSKAALEQHVSQLQEFERNYRASLRSHLEAQLGELSGIPMPTASTPAAATGSTAVAAPDDSGVISMPLSQPAPAPSADQLYPGSTGSVPTDGAASYAETGETTVGVAGQSATGEQPAQPGLGGY